MALPAPHLLLFPLTAQPAEPLNRTQIHKRRASGRSPTCVQLPSQLLPLEMDDAETGCSAPSLPAVRRHDRTWSSDWHQAQEGEESQWVHQRESWKRKSRERKAVRGGALWRGEL
ncbi:unnamed protein product [Arctogadus glacialis]